MGIHLQNNGENKITIKEKVFKAIVSSKSIQSKMSPTKMGKHYIETLKLVRNSVFLSSLLYGTKVLFNLNNDDIEALTKADEYFVK